MTKWIGKIVWIRWPKPSQVRIVGVELLGGPPAETYFWAVYM